MTLQEETELIRQRSMERLEDLCRRLLPNGKKEGCRWIAGSAKGEPGRSFDVNLRTGVFGDWADGRGHKQGGLDLWMDAQEVPFLTARKELAAWLGMPIADPDGARALEPTPKPAQPVACKQDAKRKLVLPELQVPSRGELSQIGSLRSIAVEPLSIAVNRGFLWTYTDTREGSAWLITDKARRSAIARRLDGERWQGINAKSKTLYGSQAHWPIGVLESAHYPSIAFVEGGPDFLAAIAHAWASGVQDKVAPVAMASASMSIPPEALDWFRGKRVRIFLDNDPPGRRAGNRWWQQLQGAEAQVDAFHFDGLIQTGGAAVKDLNDLLKIDVDCWEENRALIEGVMDFATEGKGVA